MSFDQLDKVVRKLRNPETGCPWDKKQTSRSLLPYFLEEVYEFIEAVEKGDEENIKEELGDLLLHIIFQGQLYEDDEKFTLSDVEKGIIEKLIYRHPHVFSGLEITSMEEIKKNWEELKKQKKKRKGLLSGVPDSLPSLLKAQRIQEKAASVGFDWKEKKEVWDKVQEEIIEIEEEIKNENEERIAEELGDLFFALTNFCRHYHFSAEFIANKGIEKFKKRFQEVEKEAGEEISSMTLEELEKIWQRIKKRKKTC